MRRAGTGSVLWASPRLSVCLSAGRWCWQDGVEHSERARTGHWRPYACWSEAHCGEQDPGSADEGLWERGRGGTLELGGGEPMGGGDDGDCGDRAGGECRRAAARLGARFRSEMGQEVSRGRTLLLGDPGNGWRRRPARPGRRGRFTCSVQGVSPPLSHRHSCPTPTTLQIRSAATTVPRLLAPRQFQVWRILALP